MNRRDFIVKTFGAAIATALAPHVDFSAPNFWQLPIVKETLPWQVRFPDGAIFAFKAEVVAEVEHPDGSVTLTIRPSSPMEIVPSDIVPDVDEWKDCGATTIKRGGTPIKREGTPTGEVVEIDLPSIVQIGADEERLPMLKRGSISFTVNWDRE